MAVTEVIQDFTYTYDTAIELAGEGEYENPSDQNAYETLATNASSVFDISMENGFATIPVFSGDMAVAEIQMEAVLAVKRGGSLEEGAVEIQMEGSLVTIGYGALGKNVLQLKMQGTMYRSRVIKGSAAVLEVQIEASGYFGHNLSMDKEAILISMEGRLLQGVDENDNVVVIPSDDDTEYPNIGGEEYVVVNLRTKAHSTYRDGERTAVAKTGSLSFDSYTEKAISDMFLLSRAKGPMEVVVQTKEDIERRYPLQFGETTQSNLKNKKLPLAKGLRGANWTISIIVPDDSHMEIRGLELYVTDLKRHN